MWARIGVKTAVDTSPYANFITRASRQEFSSFLVSWGTPTGEPGAGLRSTVATYDRELGLGSVNRARYSNPAFDKQLLAAMQVLDDHRREEMLQEATRTDGQRRRHHPDPSAAQCLGHAAGIAA